MSQLMLVNPRKRRASKKRSRVSVAKRRRRNPESLKTRRAAARRGWEHRRKNPVRRRRNPIARKTGMMDTMIMPSLMAGAGGLAVDVIGNHLPLPASMTSGPLQYVTEAALAIGLGYVAGHVTSKRNAQLLAVGGLTITAYKALTAGLGKAVPSLGVGYYNAAMPVGVGMFEATPPGFETAGTFGQPVPAPQIPASTTTTKTSGMGLYENNGIY